MDRFSVTKFLSDSIDGAGGQFTEQIGEITNQLVLAWSKIKAPLIIPLLRVSVGLCLVMLVMLFAEMVYMGVVLMVIKLLGRKPESRYKYEPIQEDQELGSLVYPMVLVQIPMYNEKKVYKLSIRAACALSWPSDRIIIQILDDSTEPEIKDMVKEECDNWAKEGVNIKCEIRDNRNGFKAGALKEGMKHEYVKHCDYVAIFDADFQPETDFLLRTVPYLIHNPELALVQGRWDFVNSKECMMTRMQEMSLNYHFTVEQKVGSATFDFFGFNGTAGVWRNVALVEAGGWKDRTTVEDMDLAVRVGLEGWKFLFLDSLKAKSELPITFKAYRYQQHRWACGPANLFKKTIMEIIRNKKVSLLKKIYLIYSFFLVRKIVCHIITFTLYCIVLPTTVLVPEVEVPKWASIYVPLIITILLAAGNTRSLHLIVIWVLFENVMSLHRMKSTFIGLFETSRVNEWVVTEKLGDTLLTKSTPEAPNRPRFRFFERLHFLELGTGAYIFLCGCYDFAYEKNHYFYYMFLQAITFFTMGFGYVGVLVPNSQ